MAAPNATPTVEFLGHASANIIRVQRSISALQISRDGSSTGTCTGTCTGTGTRGDTIPAAKPRKSVHRWNKYYSWSPKDLHWIFNA